MDVLQAVDRFNQDHGLDTPRLQFAAYFLALSALMLLSVIAPAFDTIGGMVAFSPLIASRYVLMPYLDIFYATNLTLFLAGALIHGYGATALIQHRQEQNDETAYVWGVLPLLAGALAVLTYCMLEGTRVRVGRLRA